MGEEGAVTSGGAPAKAHFVLVHGISHGAWCWYKVRTLLEKSGHKVTCPDLASAGIDRSDADCIFSFDAYNKPLTDFMSQLPNNDKVVLVGHSAGGLSVTYATHKFAKNIQLAVYVAATMIKSGITSEQDFKDGVPDLSMFGDVYELGFGLGHDNPPTSAIIRKEFHKQILHNRSPSEDSVLASMLLRPGPVMTLQNAKFDGGDDIDRVNRVYVRTTEDHVVKPPQQDAMIRRWAPWQEYTLESDHSPFFSAPAQLCSLLIKAAATANTVSDKGADG